MLLPEGTGNGEGIKRIEHDLKSNPNSTGWAIKFDGDESHLGKGTRIVRSFEEYAKARKDFHASAWNSKVRY